MEIATYKKVGQYDLKLGQAGQIWASLGKFGQVWANARIGTDIVNKMEDVKVAEYTFKRKDQVVTLANKAAIKN